MTYKEYEEKNIQSFEYETTINSDGHILGTCELGKANIQLLNNNNEYSSFKGSWIHTVHGSFYVYDVKPVQEKVNIKLSCYDIKYKLDTKYDSSLHTFPCTLKEWRNSIFDSCEVEYDNSDFPNSDLVLSEEPYIGENPINRTVIALIGQAGASFIVTDANDKFWFKWFEDTIHIAKDWLDLTTEKVASSPVNNIVLGRGDVNDDVSKPETEPENPITFRIDNNYILDPQDTSSSTDIRNQTIVPIYNRINGLSYLEFSMRTQSIENKLSVKLGQKVKYKDLYGVELTAYIMSKRIVYLGGALNDDNNYELSLSAEEIKECSSEISYSSSIKNDIVRVERKTDKNAGMIQDLVSTTEGNTTSIGELQIASDNISLRVSSVENSTEKLKLILNTNTIVVQVDENNKPLENKTYTIGYSTTFEGQDVTATYQSRTTVNGVSYSRNNAYIYLSVNKNTAIPNSFNNMIFSFTYTKDGKTYTATNNITITTVPKGADGTNGNDGSDGVGIASQVEKYLATSASSGVTKNTSGWTTTVQTVTETNKYLWNYTITTYTDNTVVETTPCIIGAYGDKGDDGEDAAIQSDTAPTDTSKIWYDTTDKAFKVYENGQWVVRGKNYENELSDKVNNNQVISSINLTPEQIKILASKLALEGYTSINNNFIIDLLGCLHMYGGDISLIDTGDDSDPQIEIYDSTAMGEAPIQVGDDLSGQTLYFNFASVNSYVDAIDQNSSIKVIESSGGYTIQGGYFYSVINGELYNLYKGSTNKATIYYTELDPNLNKVKVVSKLSSYKLPDDFGTITSINVSAGAYEYINMKSVKKRVTTFKSSGLQIYDKDNSINTKYGSHGMAIVDGYGSKYFNENGILWMTNYGTDLAQFAADKDYLLYATGAGQTTFAIESNEGNHSQDILYALINGTRQMSVDSSGLHYSSISALSLEKMKKNFARFHDGLSIVLNTDVYKYHLKSQADDEKKHIGFVIGEKYRCADEIINNKGDGIDTYSAIAAAFSAIQKQQENFESLQEGIKRLKEENRLFKEEIKKLKEMVGVSE